MQWAVVVPVKELAVAKTRLGLPSPLREDVALAMACDVVSACVACDAVAGVVVVTNDLRAAAAVEPLGARVVADVADAGLNPALVDGARYAAVLWTRSGVAAVSSDLAALRPTELAEALAAATAHDRALVADSTGAGTTLLTALPGVALDPRFGPSSRAAHVAAGVAQLPLGAWPSLERDVDTLADLRAALELGAGAATARLAPHLGT